MITIRDLIEQGVYLQGTISVIKWDCNMNDAEAISTTSNMNGENIPEEALDLEIKYMYAEDNNLIIEVVEK